LVLMGSKKEKKKQVRKEQGRKGENNQNVV
jgi:hypothetical protein